MSRNDQSVQKPEAYMRLSLDDCFKMLRDLGLRDDGNIYSAGQFTCFSINNPEECTLDSEFTSDQLFAIAWWMKARDQFECIDGNYKRKVAKQ